MTEPRYLHWPERLSEAQAPLCARFVKSSRLDWGSTIRWTLDGTPMFQVFLQSEHHRARAVEVEPVNVARAMMARNESAIVAEVERAFSGMIAKVDFQLAAYCASNLWC